MHVRTITQQKPTNRNGARQRGVCMSIRESLGKSVRLIVTAVVAGPLTSTANASDHHYRFDGANRTPSKVSETGGSGTERFRIAQAQPSSTAGQEQPSPSSKVRVNSEDELLEIVVVTGTRLRDPDAISANPITVLDTVVLEQSGKVSLDDVFATLPDARTQGTGGASTAGSQGDQGFVDLHHLGYGRTLVLIDGHRATPTMVSSGINTISVNTSTIPLGMIGRVEVLQDGASPVYGADAIGGVVNLILRDSFEGLELYGQAGAATVGDRESYRSGLMAGHDFARGNVSVAFEYNERQEARYDERAEYAFVANSIGALPGGAVGVTSTGNVYTPGGIAVVGPPGSPPGSVPTSTFTAPGVFRPYNPVTDNVPTDPNTTIAPYISSLAVMPTFTYELTDGIDFHVDALYSEQDTEAALTLLPRRPLAIPASAPGNPFGAPVELYRTTFPEAGYPTWATEQENSRVVAGFEGGLMDDRFRWALDYIRGRTREQMIQADLEMDAGGPNSRLATALDPARCAVTAGCVPANFFGPGALDSRSADFFMLDIITDTGYDQETIDGSVNGKLFDLPAGSVVGAAGFSWREESGFRRGRADPAVPSPAVPSTFDGDIDAKEVFAEFNLPLLSDMAVARAFDLNLAARYSDFSVGGESTTWKVGINWALTDTVRIRGNRSTGFRAPNIGEAFGAPSQVLQRRPMTEDPCRSTRINPTYAPGCAAAGIPPGGLATPGGPVGAGVTFSGNPDLASETSDNWSLGVVLTPSWSLNSSLSVSYYHVELEDAISAIDPLYALQQCYSSGATLGSSYCALITRGPGGYLANIDAPYANSGIVDTDGIDFSLETQFSAGEGAISLGFDGNYIMNFEIQNQAGSPFQELAGLLNVSLDYGSLPRFRGAFHASYAAQSWIVGWNTQIVGSAKVANSSPPPGVPSNPFNEVSTVYYHDIFGDLEIGRSVSVGLGVRNVFDKQAPFIFPGNFAFGVYDSVGRTAYMRGRVRF